MLEAVDIAQSEVGNMYHAYYYVAPYVEKMVLMCVGYDRFPWSGGYGIKVILIKEGLAVTLTFVTAMSMIFS